MRKIFGARFRWSKKRVIILLNEEELEVLKNNFCLSSKLTIKVRRWWMTENILNYINIRFFKKTERNVKVKVGKYDPWEETIIFYPDFLMFARGVHDIDGFKLALVSIIAHEFKHAQEDPVALMVSLLGHSLESIENIVKFEDSAEIFSKEKSYLFNDLIIVKEC